MHQLPGACYCGHVVRYGGLLDLPGARRRHARYGGRSRARSEWAQIGGQEIAGVVREARSRSLFELESAGAVGL